MQILFLLGLIGLFIWLLWVLCAKTLLWVIEPLIKYFAEKQEMDLEQEEEPLENGAEEDADPKEKYAELRKIEHKKGFLVLNMFHEDLIVLNFHAKDRKDVLWKIADLFYEKNFISDRDDFYKKISYRESLGSISYEGVLITDVEYNAHYQIVAAMLIAKEGIDYSSADGKPTHVFIPVIGAPKVPDKITGLRLKSLARLSRLLRKEDLKAELMQAKNINEIFAIIEKYEKK